MATSGRSIFTEFGSHDIQIVGPRCLSVEMHGNSCFRARLRRVVICFLAAAMFLSVGFVRIVRAPTNSGNDNPQDFYLWSTGSSFAYTFRYDPRAADVWSFKSGGHTRFIVRDLSNLPGNHTNR